MSIGCSTVSVPEITDSTASISMFSITYTQFCQNVGQKKQILQRSIGHYITPTSRNHCSSSVPEEENEFF